MNTERDFPVRPWMNLNNRGSHFALEIIRLYSDLPSGTVEKNIGKQLLRAGTSVGAHLSEGKRSRSRAEVISKTEVALQELEESVYSMNLLQDLGVKRSFTLEKAFREADELTAILVTGVNRLKNLKTEK